MIKAWEDYRSGRFVDEHHRKQYKMDIVSGMTLAATGSVVYPCLFMYIKSILSKYVMGKSFSKHDKVDMANKLTSALHAILSSMAGLVITLNCYKDIKYDRHWMTNSFAWFGFPYFVYDLCCMFYVFQHLPQNEGKVFGLLTWQFLCYQPVIVFHHFILAFLGLPAIVHFRGGIGDYYIGSFYLAELSTPFVSFRAVLSKLNMKKTLLYKVNGLLMIGLFFIFRICLFPFLYYTYARYADITIFQVFKHIPLKCNASSALFVFFQLYWFVVMVKGALKVFKHTKSDSRKGESAHIG